MQRRYFAPVILSLAALAAPAFAATPAVPDISGTFTTSFDSQVGTQSYTFTFVAKGGQLTGQAKSANGDDKIEEGKVDGDKVSFIENMNYQNIALRIAYTGTIVSANEIKFKRDVGGQGGEEFTAKRLK
ncbi:MAG TPA: hypothetical protein VMH83_15645 [Candidatus Acidoferrum sp.]|nr:hypothetical protein [Candidatus Acidoferrum sp.]